MSVNLVATTNSCSALPHMLITVINLVVEADFVTTYLCPQSVQPFDLSHDGHGTVTQATVGAIGA